MNPPVVLEKHRSLIAWVIPRLAEFPKDQRYLLADRIQRSLLDIQELLVRAVYSKEKERLLEEINIQLDVVRLLMRTAKDMTYMSLKRHDYFCRSVDEVGRMVGGWKKNLSVKVLSGNQSPGGYGFRSSDIASGARSLLRADPSQVGRERGGRGGSPDAVTILAKGGVTPPRGGTAQ